jgi:hypothetical protein
MSSRTIKVASGKKGGFRDSPYLFLCERSGADCDSQSHLSFVLLAQVDLETNTRAQNAGTLVKTNVTLKRFSSVDIREMARTSQSPKAQTGHFIPNRREVIHAGS